MSDLKKSNDSSGLATEMSDLKKSNGSREPATEMGDFCEKEISSEELYSGKVAHLYRDMVMLPNGHVAVREVLKHLGAVCVVPLTDENEVVLVRQFRYPFKRVLLEIPAGKLEPTEPPEAAAMRELSEETGYSARELISLGEFLPTVAITDENIRMFLARGLTSGKTHPDDDEFLSVEKLPLKALVNMVMANEIKDGKTQAAILKTWLYLNAKQC